MLLHDVKQSVSIIDNPDIKVVLNNDSDSHVISKHGYNLDIGSQIGFIAKKVSQDKELNIQQRSEIVHALKNFQINAQVYPYDRYIKEASNNLGVILSRSEAAKSDKKHYVWNLNHYLGLNRNPEVIKFSQECIRRYGTGSGTSMVAGGMNEIHRKIEQFFSKYWGKEESIIFPTGYTANLGTISALVGQDDLVLIDKECHASIIDGVKLSKAQLLPFRHNDPIDLEKKLQKYSGKYHNVLVVIESVYSMTGDEAPVVEISALKNKFNFLLYVDEAHSVGFYGDKGRGLCYEKGCIDSVDIMMTTLSKSTGSAGGIVSCSKELATYIQVKSSPYLFQACLSPGDAGAVYKALEILTRDTTYQDILWKNTNHFRGKLLEKGFDCRNSKSPIVPIYMSDPNKLALMCKEIFENGIFTNWVAYPVVGLHEGRLRFIVTANHTKEDINSTVEILYSAYKKITE